MKLLKLLTITLCIIILGVSTFGYSETTNEILRKLDEYRLIGNNFEMTIRVEGYINNRLENSTLMKAFIKNDAAATINFLEPQNTRGRKLVIQEKNMWLVIPNVKNPIRISPSQRLIGGISYGDIIGVSYINDYNVKTIGEEFVSGMNPDGSHTDPNPCQTLELSAKVTGTKYNKMIFWVNKQDFFPVKADFFALSGKKMATVFYTAPKDWDGKTIITKMFLYDQINVNRYFTIEYSDIKAAQIPNN